MTDRETGFYKTVLNEELMPNEKHQSVNRKRFLGSAFLISFVGAALALALFSGSNGTNKT